MEILKPMQKLTIVIEKFAMSIKAIISKNTQTELRQPTEQSIMRHSVIIPFQVHSFTKTVVVKHATIENQTLAFLRASYPEP
ncbi:hypothetical protein CEXT_78881 [Caerostris extrusa]|uniref:Uncharacterized protein n=1 Tax=Caerostris extrusa TaxID=172846 RepID=A0AAV4VQ67_CAEEX|nr:hypothetical protein CEXT_78881 [Caerostris extrusa]